MPPKLPPPVIVPIISPPFYPLPRVLGDPEPEWECVGDEKPQTSTEHERLSAMRASMTVQAAGQALGQMADRLKEEEAACEFRAAEMRFENLHSEGADRRVISEAVLALQGFNNLLQQREQETQKVFHCQAEPMWAQSEDERALQALARLEQEAHNDYLVVETTAMNIMDEMDEGLQL